MFFLRVCTGAYATFSLISRSTVTVVHSITVSYSGPGCTCGAGWLDCVSSDPVLPSGDVLEDRLCLQHKQMQTMITKVGTSKLIKSTSEKTTTIAIFTLLDFELSVS
jgi:hypothetical protein